MLFSSVSNCCGSMVKALIIDTAALFRNRQLRNRFQNTDESYPWHSPDLVVAAWHLVEDRDELQWDPEVRFAQEAIPADIGAEERAKQLLCRRRMAEATIFMGEERLQTENQTKRSIIMDFLNAVASTDVVVGHNVAYDLKVLRAEAIRSGIQDFDAALQIKEVFCTCTSGIGLDGRKLAGGRPKYPKLIHLYAALYGNYRPKDDIIQDIEQCGMCYFALRDR